MAIQKSVYTDVLMNYNLLQNVNIKNIVVKASDENLNAGGLTYETNPDYLSDDKIYSLSLVVDDKNTKVPLLTSNLYGAKTYAFFSNTYTDAEATADAETGTVLVFGKPNYDSTNGASGEEQVLKSNIKLGEKIDFKDIEITVLNNEEVPSPLMVYYNSNQGSSFPTSGIKTEDVAAAGWTTKSDKNTRKMSIVINGITSASASTSDLWENKDTKVPTAGATWKLVQDQLQGSVSKATVYISGLKATDTDKNTDKNGNILNQLLLGKTLSVSTTDGSIVKIPAGTPLNSSNTTLWQILSLNNAFFDVELYTNSSGKVVNPFTDSDDENAASAKSAWSEPVLNTVNNAYYIWAGETEDVSDTTYKKAENKLANTGDTALLTVEEDTSKKTINVDFSIKNAKSNYVDLSTDQTNIAGTKTFKKINIDLKQDDTNSYNNIITNAVINNGDAGNKTKNIFASSLQVNTVSEANSTTNTTSAAKSTNQNVVLTDEPKLDIPSSGTNTFVKLTDAGEIDSTYAYNENLASGSKLITELALAKALDNFSSDNEFYRMSEFTLQGKDDLNTNEVTAGYNTYCITLTTQTALGDSSENKDDYWGKADGKGRWNLIKFAEVKNVLIATPNGIGSDGATTYNNYVQAQCEIRLTNVDYTDTASGPNASGSKYESGLTNAYQFDSGITAKPAKGNTADLDGSTNGQKPTVFAVLYFKVPSNNTTFGSSKIKVYIHGSKESRKLS